MITQNVKLLKRVLNSQADAVVSIFKDGENWEVQMWKDGLVFKSVSNHKDWAVDVFYHLAGPSGLEGAPLDPGNAK